MRSTTKTNVIDRVIRAGRIAKVLGRAMLSLRVVSLYSRKALMAPAMAHTASGAFASVDKSTDGKRDTNPCGHERSRMCWAHQGRLWRPSQQQVNVPVAFAW